MGPYRPSPEVPPPRRYRARPTVLAAWIVLVSFWIPLQVALVASLVGLDLTGPHYAAAFLGGMADVIVLILAVVYLTEGRHGAIPWEEVDP